MHDERSATPIGRLRQARQPLHFGFDILLRNNNRRPKVELWSHVTAAIDEPGFAFAHLISPRVCIWAAGVPQRATSTLALHLIDREPRLSRGPRSEQSTGAIGACACVIPRLPKRGPKFWYRRFPTRLSSPQSHAIYRRVRRSRGSSPC